MRAAPAVREAQGGGAAARAGAWPGEGVICGSGGQVKSAG
jgi:hypothetical protein